MVAIHFCCKKEANFINNIIQSFESSSDHKSTIYTLDKHLFFLVLYITALISSESILFNKIAKIPQHLLIKVTKKLQKEK